MPVRLTLTDSDGLDPDVIERGMLAGAELLLDESNRKVPLETGTLIRSGTAAAQGNEAAVGYNTPYAVRQHEELGYAHPGQGEAKFLETAMHNNRDAILGAIADTSREGLA